jgi:tetratricopeptide (TPR) repeat protein
MAESDEYRRTFMDRHGPDAGRIIMAFAFMLLVAGLTTSALTTQLGFHWLWVIIGVAAGSIAGSTGYWLGEAAGGAFKRVMFDGASTPYVEQYSYQQALVMQGKLDDALASFEAVIAENPGAVDARIRAAELYHREGANPARAAELFRQVQRIETVTAGQFIHAANRLVDLYTGPLNEPGKALVELRKLIDKFPGSPAAEHARDALKSMKPSTEQPAPPPSNPRPD